MIRLSMLVRARFAPVVVVAAGLLMTNCASASTNAVAPAVAPKELKLAVAKEFPHDPTCFVQGFQWTSTVSGGGFYESCGKVGSSSMRITTLRGKVLKKKAVPDVFAEGAVRLGNRLYQLTWKERVVFVRNPTTLAVIEELSLPSEINEGWGLTTLGSELVISDGTSNIYFVDPKAWKVTRTISVNAAGIPVDQLNELELIDGQLWANVWNTERIVVIDPKNGQVTANVSLVGLRPPSTNADGGAVPNGIAYDPKTKRIFVTGKNWPVVFQVTTQAA